MSGTNLPLWYRAEVDTADRTVGQHVTEIPLSLGDSRCRIPVEADAYLLCHRPCSHTGLTVAVAGVKGKTHDLELLTASAGATQCVKLVYLIHLRIEEMPVSLRHTHHEGRVGHVGVNLLDNQSLGTLPLVLVGTLR